MVRPFQLIVIGIAFLSFGLISYVFFMVNEQQMQIKHDIERTRSLRIRANEGKKGGNILPERERENV